MKEYDREIKKAYERMGKLKSDVNNTPRIASIIMYAATALTILCLALSLFQVNEYLANIAPWGALGGAGLVLLVYLLCKLGGATKYIEVVIKHEGVYLLFQVVTEKHVIFTDGNFVLEYKKGNIKEIDSILNPYLSYDAPLKAEYSNKTLSRMGNYYDGVSNEFGDKPVKYKVTMEKKFVTGFKANGKRALFDCINDKDSLLTIPAVMAAEIKERGVKLPRDIVAK